MPDLQRQTTKVRLEWDTLARMEDAVTERHDDGLPTWVPRLLGMIVGTILGTLAVLWILGKVQSLLITILLSLFVSFAFEPAVFYLAKRGWRRGAATALVFAVAGITGLLFVALTLPPLVIQTADIVSNIPAWLTDLSGFLNDRFGVDVNLSNLSTDVIDVQGALQNYAASLASGVLGIGSAVLSLVLQVVTMGLFTFYLLADGPRVRRVVLSVVRPDRQTEVARMWEVAIEKTGGYVYSRALLAMASAVFTYAALRIIGVPFALALAVWVGVISQFIPAVGTYLAAIVPVLVALTDKPSKAVWVVVVLVVYQQIENILIAPKITAHTMSLHPAVAFGSAIAGASILGPVGALIALPVAATVQAFISTYFERYHVDEATVERNPAERSSGNLKALLGMGEREDPEGSADDE